MTTVDTPAEAHVELDEDFSRGLIAGDPARVTARVAHLPNLGTPSIDAAGSTIAFGVVTADPAENSYQAQIWVSEDRRPATPRAFGGEYEAYSPALAPDGKHLLFSRPDTSGRPQLHLATLDGSSCSQITDAPMGVAAGRWSPSGRAVAYVTRTDPTGSYTGSRQDTQRTFTGLGGFADGFGATVDRPRRIEVVHPFDSPCVATVVAPETLDATDPGWSPDSTHLTFTGRRGQDLDLSARNTVAIAPIDGSSIQILVAENLVVGCPRFTPDGTDILFAGEELDDEGLPRAAGSFGVWQVPATGGPAVRITDEERYHIGFSCQTQQPITDGFLAGIDNAGATELLRFRLESATPEKLITGDRQVNGFTAVSNAAGDLTVAAMVADSGSSGEIVVVDGTGETSVTTFGAQLSAACGVYPPEPFSVESDGWSIHGWKVVPTGPGPFPAVLSIKGGPFTQFGYTLSGPAALDDAQVYADAGIAVILVNPRGTSGYGQAHGRAATPLAEVTARDLLAALDHALDDPRLDPKRVGLTGGSFGGYMTAWLAAKAPERFRAGICERGVYEIDSFAASGDDGWNTATALYGRDRSTWPAQSPVTYADDIAIPLLIMHSYQDGHCPFSQAQRLLFELRVRRKIVQLAAFEDEGHELSRSGAPANRIQRLLTTLTWWSEHLSVGGAS